MHSESLHTMPGGHHAAQRSAVSAYAAAHGRASFPAAAAPPVAQLQAAPQQSLLAPQAGAGEVIQRYFVANIDGTDYQASENIDLAVSVPDAQRFHAGPQVPVADNVLDLVHTFEETGNRIFKINVPYVKDCGEYAVKLMVEIAKGSFNRSTHRNTREYIETDSPQPGIGDAFYVKSLLSDPKYGKEHFNHHYGVVVAKSSNDVVTAEADSTKEDMAFHMYNTSKFGQSFREEYIRKDKLAESAQAMLYKSKIESKK